MTGVSATNRQQILEVAADLLEREGAQALSTRAVAAAAGIRAASLYQLFGDKDGLLKALAVLAFDRYLGEKSQVAVTEDPVESMRAGWDAHVDFGLRHPALYLLMFGTDRPGRPPAVADEAHDLLMSFLDRVADAGRLRVLPGVAARLLQASVVGVTLTLLADPEKRRDRTLSARMREAVITSLVTDSPPAADAGLAARALALDSALAAEDETALPLRPAETALLRDWLHRLAEGPASPAKS